MQSVFLLSNKLNLNLSYTLAREFADSVIAQGALG
jgi:hypothetical protein